VAQPPGREKGVSEEGLALKEGSITVPYDKGKEIHREIRFGERRVRNGERRSDLKGGEEILWFFIGKPMDETQQAREPRKGRESQGEGRRNLRMVHRVICNLKKRQELAG